MTYQIEPDGRAVGPFTVWALLFAILTALLVWFAMPQAAYGMRLTLKRVIFEGSQRSEVLTIINNTNKEQTFRLGWRDFRMTADKALDPVKNGEDAGDIRPARDLVRFSPRRVTIPPQSSQQVRLMVRKPKDLEDGEYRSHLWIVPEENVRAFGAENEQQPKPDRPVISLTMLAGVTMPVIVRHGDLSATAGIRNITARTAEGGLDVSFTLTREGDKSLYGDISIACAGEGSPPLKTVRGIAIYAETPLRNQSYRTPAPKTACPGVEITYSEPADSEGRPGAVLANGSAPIQ